MSAHLALRGVVRRGWALVLITTPLFGQAAPNEARLRTLAEVALRTEGRIIMTGDLAGALAATPDAAAIRRGMDRPGAKSRARRSALAKGEISVTRTSENVQVIRVVPGDTISLFANVRLERYMNAKPGQPEKWVETGEYVFRFVPGNTPGSVELVSFGLVNPFGQRDAQPLPPGEQKATGARSTTDPARPGKRPTAPPGRSGSSATPTRALFSFASVSSPAVRGGAVYVYDGIKARDYARRYACSTCYNTAYRNFENSGTRGGDCTNFISQSLRAGGWPDVGGYTDRTTTSAWWYDSFTQTYTWVGAHYFYQFAATHSDRMGLAGNVWSMIPGDVLQVDFEGDGEIDHTTIVSWRYENPVNLYLSYHTNGTLDRPLSDFFAAVAADYPAPNQNSYYGWWVW